MEKRKKTTDKHVIYAVGATLLFLTLMVSWPTISTHIDVYSFYAETRGVGALYDLLVEKYYQ
ncbi:hypothetical protein QNE79_004661 [Vibrio alginolyticus]|nr:hypothetical protein [Vibrio alginolyticus]